MLNKKRVFNDGEVEVGPCFFEDAAWSGPTRWANVACDPLVDVGHVSSEAHTQRSAGHILGCAAKNRQMTEVAETTVGGGSNIAIMRSPPGQA